MNIKRGFGSFRRSHIDDTSKGDTLAATVEAKAQKLESQQASHKRARRNAQSDYRTSLRVLKTRVGAHAVEHGLVVLSEVELEGAFIDLKNRMTDAEILAGWAEGGKLAAAERVEVKRAKTMFFVGVREPVSEVFRESLVEIGFRFSTRSARYATIVAAEMPDGLIDLAMANGQAVWTLDENADKVFLYRPDDQLPATGPSAMLGGRMRASKATDPASLDDAEADALRQSTDQGN